jgi:hypothetical protein
MIGGRKEAFLARCRHRNEQAIRFAIGNLLDDLGLLIRAKIAVPQSGKLYRREMSDNDVGSPMQNIRRSAKKERAEPIPGTDGQNLPEQVDAGNALLYRNSEQPQGKNDAHTVNSDDVASHHIGTEDPIRTHIYELGDVQGHMLQPPSVAHCHSGTLDGFSHRQNVDRTSQQICAHARLLKPIKCRQFWSAHQELQAT